MLQEFHIEIRDKKRVENVKADHLSWLPTDGEAKDPLLINEYFSDEQLFQIITHTNTSAPWYADIVNYLATIKIPSYWSSIDRNKFFRNVRYFSWKNPYLFKYFPDQVVRWCVPEEKVKSVIEFYYSQACNGHFHHAKLLQRSCKVGFIGPLYFMMFIHFARLAIDANV